MKQSYLIAGLAMAALLLTIAPAHGQIETLVMPGELIEAHAEYESECSNCHAKFDRGKQRELCLACHEDIAADLVQGVGFHSRSSRVGDRQCSACHTDHEGRNAEITDARRARFKHDDTDFPLLGKHEELQCDSCHAPDTRRRDAPSDCFSCHRDDNPHDSAMGEDCAGCHNPSDWTDTSFDHESTGFSLIGKHGEAECTACHVERQFENTPNTCYDCHAKDDHHDGRSGTECGNCHRPTAWSDTQFDHSRDTDFELLGRHADLACGDCHSDDPFGDTMDTACVACHEDDDNHDGHNGRDCAACHASDDWALVRFDHFGVTGHALLGAHEELECKACHIEPIFDLALQSDCGTCHEDDDAHEGTQGIECADCHNEAAWENDVFFDHGLTRFPLLGKHADAECESCHQSHVFKDAPEDCVSCHRDDDRHQGRFPSDCSYCHNPVSFAQWQFDHNRVTNFRLDGAHADVDCETCHRGSIAAQSQLGSRCGDCHANDDIHNGEFGPQCDRCHSPDSFTEVRSIR